MTKFIIALKDSFLTLLQKPKLFVPKILISILYSIPLLFVPALTISTFTAPSFELLNQLIFWLLFVLATNIIDILINAMYPFLVKDFFEDKNVGLYSAFKKALKKFFKVVPTLLMIDILFIIAIIILAFPFAIFILTQNTLGIFFIAGISLFLIFLLTVFFFMIYPVLTLENNSALSSVKRSFSISKKNFSDVSKATIFSMIVSIISFGLSYAVEILNRQEFFIGSLIALILFIFLRILIAVFATYQYVLNPVFYLEIEKGERLE